MSIIANLANEQLMLESGSPWDEVVMAVSNGANRLGMFRVTNMTITTSSSVLLSPVGFEPLEIVLVFVSFSTVAFYERWRWPDCKGILIPEGSHNLIQIVAVFPNKTYRTLMHGSAKGAVDNLLG